MGGVRSIEEVEKYTEQPSGITKELDSQRPPELASKIGRGAQEARSV